MGRPYSRGQEADHTEEDKGRPYIVQQGIIADHTAENSNRTRAEHRAKRQRVKVRGQGRLKAKDMAV
jgi:hypothetical protein